MICFTRRESIADEQRKLLYVASSNFCAQKLTRRRSSQAILQKLQTKARLAFDTFVNSGGIPVNPSTISQPSQLHFNPDGSVSTSSGQNYAQGEDELAIFGGRARVLSPKRSSPSPAIAHAVSTPSFGDLTTPPPPLPTPTFQRQLPQQQIGPGVGGLQSQYMRDVKPPLALAVSLSTSTSTSSAAGPGSVDSGMRDLSSPPSSLADYGEKGMPAWSVGREYRDERDPGAAYDSQPQYLVSQPQQTYGSQDWLMQQSGDEFRAYRQYASGSQRQSPMRSASSGYSYQQQQPQLQRQPSHLQGYPSSVSVSVEFSGMPSQQTRSQNSAYGPSSSSATPSGAQPTPYPYSSQQPQATMPQSATSPYGHPSYSYSPAPRELAAMGLATQHSGMNQRWTSFMQESGVFYGGGGGGGM